VSGLTHLAGAFLAVAGTVALMLVGNEEAGRSLALGVYGTSLIFLYSASAFYHLLPLSPAGVARLRRVDHAAIFALIAGTYTPVCLISLPQGWGWGLLACVWGLAAAGIFVKLGRMDAPRWLTVWLYLGLGWIAVVAAPVLLQALPFGGTLWFLAGGIVYSAGAAVYALKRPDFIPGVFGFHEVWHLFVLAGSACHFWAILRYVAPVA